VARKRATRSEEAFQAAELTDGLNPSPIRVSSRAGGLHT
jgi:hypothetical protein